MTTLDLTLKRGDSRHLLFAVTDTSVPALPVDITGAVIKFAVKDDADDPNPAAIVFKASYRPIEIQITDAVNGKLTVKIEKEDTIDEEPACLAWDLEVTRQGETRPGAAVGTIAVSAGSGVVTGTGTQLTKFRRGDVLLPAGGFAPNMNPVTIAKIVSDTILETDYVDWTTEAGISFSAFVGDVKTPGSGKFTLTEDTIR